MPMKSKLQNELKQNKPFQNLQEEALLNIVRTAEVFSWQAASLFKEIDLTATQYNVLRILRGAGNEGLLCREISERMLTKDPDITRLLDRLELRGFISRNRNSHDRRVITVKITSEGLEVLNSLDKPIEEHHQKLLGHLTQEQLQQLISLLELARNNII